MSKGRGFARGSGNDLKKDFKNIFKHSKRAMKGFFRGRDHDGCDEGNNCCGNGPGCGGGRPPGGWYPPFLKPKSPWVVLFYPKICIGGLLLLTLLLCGVSLYGLIIIILLTIIFIIIW